jgi:COP9 signalosome complex subunit 1
MIEQHNYSHLSTYVFKADAALDSATSAAASSCNNGGDLVMATTAAGAAKKKGTLGSGSSAERDTYQSKLDLASALSYLGQVNYERAA